MLKTKKYFSYAYLNTKTTFKTISTYKTASILNLITQITMILAQFYLWKAIYNNTSNINNYSFPDMITYLVISYSISRLYPFNVSNKFGRMVKNGDIIHSLLKPMSFEYQLLTESFGELIYKLFFIAIPIMTTGYVFIGCRIVLSFNEAILFLVFFTISYIFVFVLELFIGVFSFYTLSLWGINNFKTSIINLLSGKLLPLNFYPLVYRKFILYLPFSSIYFIPINILMGKEVGNFIFFLLIISCSTIILIILYKLLSLVMIKKIMIQGG